MKNETFNLLETANDKALAERISLQDLLMLDASEEVLALFKKLGITQSDAAKRLGCTEGNISRLLNPDRNLTLRSLADLSWVAGHRVKLEFSKINAEQREPIEVTHQELVGFSSLASSATGSNVQVAGNNSFALAA